MTLVRESLIIDRRPSVVLSAGAGPSLVFLHGGGIVEGFDCLTPLATRHRLVVPLMPGFGGTSLDPPVRSRDDLVARTIAVLDELGIGELALVGHSVGGWLAAAVAVALGDRVTRLVLAAPYGLEVGGHPLADVGAMTPDQERAALTNDPSVWNGRIPIGPDPEFGAARRLEGTSLGRFMPGPFDPGLPELAGALIQPTLLLWGDDDRIVPVEHAAAWQPLVPNARLALFPGAGHLLFHERREAVDAVAAFTAGR